MGAASWLDDLAERWSVRWRGLLRRARNFGDQPARHVVVTVNAAWNVVNFREPLVRALLDDGNRVTILAPRDDAVPRLEAMGCVFRDLEMDTRSVDPFNDMRFAGRLQRHFKALNPDIVLSFTIKNNIYGALAARALKIPFIPNISGLGTAFLSGGAMKQVAENLYRMAFSHLPAVVFQNPDDRTLFRERGLIRGHTEGILVPGSGIDLERFAPAPYPPAENGIVFVLVARLLREKGIYEFVDAARMLREKYPHAKFRLLGEAGDVNPSALPRELVQRWEDEGLIEYCGFASDVRPFVAAAHCVVLPSWREGAPRTLIEGAAMARPLIATDVPGCRAVVEHDYNGFLCEARNADSLAGAIESFLALSQPEREAMGAAGRELATRKFAASKVSDAYLKAIADYSVSYRI